MSYCLLPPIFDDIDVICRIDKDADGPQKLRQSCWPTITTWDLRASIGRGADTEICPRPGCRSCNGGNDATFTIHPANQQARRIGDINIAVLVRKEDH